MQALRTSLLKEPMATPPPVDDLIIEPGQGIKHYWRNGSPTREFLYVEAAAEGILLAAERYNDSQPVNLGSSYEISIKELTETIARVVGFAGDIVWDTSKPNGQPRRKLDTSRAYEMFGFQSQVCFEDGLRHTVEDYKQTLYSNSYTERLEVSV